MEVAEGFSSFLSVHSPSQCLLVSPVMLPYVPSGQYSQSNSPSAPGLSEYLPLGQSAVQKEEIKVVEEPYLPRGQNSHPSCRGPTGRARLFVPGKEEGGGEEGVRRLSLCYSSLVGFIGNTLHFPPGVTHPSQPPPPQHTTTRVTTHPTPCTSPGGS